MSNPTSKDYAKWFNRRKQHNDVSLSEQEWLDFWINSQRWDSHGTFKDSVVMARIDLDGAYAAGNIELITKREAASRAGKRGWHSAR